MGPVAPFLLALQKIGIAVAGAIGGLGAAASLGIGQAIALGGAVVAGATLVANKALSAMYEIDMPKVDTDASRQRTVKSTTEPYKTIYGETLVSGPISYIGMAGTNNEDLYHVIALAGHEVTDITDIYFDNELIQDSQINGGSSAGGNVTAGTFGPKNSTTICIINKHLGTATQAADSMMVGAFADYTSAHQGKGIAYIAMKWKLNEDSAEVWDKYAPSDIKAIVKGKPVYDPRLDTGGYGDDPTNDLFITYNATAGSYVGQGQNPALVLADYLINDDFGMGIAPSKIDWNAVVTAANGCDVSVVVPNGTQKRFTVNGVLFGTDSHRTNINKILSSMNGHLVYSNGKYILHAGIYEAPTESLNEDDLIGAIGIKTSFERSDRFNTIKGLFVDPAQNHKSTEFPKVQLADAVTRDNGEVLEKEVQFPMTNSSYMAQRLSNKLIQLSDQQKVVTFPANLSALRITAGDRVQVSVDELSWSNKVFMCVGWAFSDEGGVNLTLREDSSTSYADPATNEYSTITATGDITDAFRGVPSPSGLSVTAGLKNNELNWVNPARPADYGTIYVYASRNANFSSAVKIGETDGTQFIHDASNKSLIFSPSVVNVGDTYTIRTVGDTNFVAMGAASNTVGEVFTATSTGSGTGSLWETLASGNLRYYWVRAVKNIGTDAASQSNLEPNADPNTTVFATVGRVNWADVSGSTNAPADNATVGAQISVNLYDADGSTVMNQDDVKNSVLAQEILQVEVEAGEVLDLETGQNVDIQNLGDVAIYVSDSNQTLNSSINTVAQNLSSLEDTIVDLTSGVSDIYIQANEPVAGVGGIPDPIPTFSRWYDSDDQNHPYYWTGSAWASLKDAQIAQNATAITNLQTSLATTNSNVTSNASAISVLDATTVSQGNSITSITSDVTALETTVNDASTGVAANATGLSNLTTRVTTAEGAITTNASDITTLQTDVTTAEGNITTNATAISGLDTRVTTAEGTITTQSSDITALESTVNDGTTGVAANASGLSALTTRVTTAEGAITTNSSAVTTLNATYTEDLHFRTEVEDESDDLIDLETSGTVQLQDLTDFVAGSSSAIDALTVQTYVNENSIQTQAIQITALESTVNDPTNGVVATAGALSSLSTEVSVIDGVVTSTAQDLTTLTTTVGQNTASISTQATSINGVEANYSVKIDNNNRITGFGLLSTTAGATPFSEFAVVADQFSIVSPDSTADTPIQPFTVTADKIYFGADVVVSGDLISTGTISADRLQIDNVMFDTETVGGVTSLIIKASGVNTSQIAENAITTARLSNDAVTVDKFANTLQSTNYVAGTSGWQILTDGDVEFQNATINGDITATSLTVEEANITGTLTLGGGVLQDGAGNNLTQLTTLNAQQIMSEVTGVISQAQHDIPSFWRITTNDDEAPSNSEFNTAAGRLPKVNDLVITTDTTTTPETTYGWTCTAAGVADPATEATWSAITNFISGDLLVDGSIGAEQISANAVTADKILAGSVTTNKLSVVGKGSSLNSDPNIEDSTAWVLFTGTTGTFETITDGLVGNKTLRSGTPASAGSWYNGSERLPLDPNKTYRMTAVARKSSDADGTLYAGVAAFEADGTNIGGSSQWSYGAATANGGSTTFTRYVMEFGAGTSNTFPSNAVTFAPLVILNYDSTAGYFEAQDIRIEEKISASLIVDGTITADQIAANTITANQIASNAIGTNQLTVGVGTTLGLADTSIQPGDDITSGTAGPVTITSTSLYQGAGNFNNADTGFYLDNSANFSLQDKLAFNGTDLTVSGDVTAASFTLSSGATLNDADDKISNTNNNAFFRFETAAGGDDVSAPDNTTFNSQFGRNPRTNDVLVVVNTASNPEVSTMYVYVSNAWVEKADFFTGDIIIDGTLSADKITVGSLNATNITGDIDTFVSFNTSTTQSLSPDDGETVIQTIVIPANTLGHTPVIHAACQIQYAANFDSGQDYGVSFRVRDTNVTGTVISTLFYTRRKSSAGTLENDSVFIFATDTKTTAEKTYVITAYASSGNDSDDVDIDAIEGIAIGAR